MSYPCWLWASINVKTYRYWPFSYPLFEMKHSLKQKSSRTALHFLLSDCIVAFHCLSAINGFMIQLLIECISFPAVFIYSMPGYTCSIRERMLYSSCKSPLLEIVETQLWMQIVRKVSAGGLYGYFLHACLPFLMENYNCLCHHLL